MATSDSSKVDGFVLREFPYKESSKIIEVFTRELGKISILAKGVLRPKNKNLSASMRFVKARYFLYKTKTNFYGIRESELLETYSKSNKNFDIIVYKSAICDLLLRTIDHTQFETTYKLLDNIFEAFEKSEKNRANIFYGFLIKYISFSGFKPNLGTSALSGKKITNEAAYFSYEYSSLISLDMRGKIKDRVYLSKDEINYIKKILYTSSSDLENIDLSLIDQEKIGKLIMDYCLEKLELKKFNSIEWIYKSIENRR
ncbi:MAG: DNA repair protein RecO [Peptoniphilaceae bacterium]|nr:DNA repair protein RecO [Peptoniphilaceae bacterium]MDY6018389.1 DNA repair protein RecO [Anaerococcus sp.]